MTLRYSIKTLVIGCAIACVLCAFGVRHARHVKAEQRLYNFVAEQDAVVMYYAEFISSTPSGYTSAEKWSPKHPFDTPPEHFAIINFAGCSLTPKHIDDLSTLLRQYPRSIHRINFDGSWEGRERIALFADEFDRIHVSINEKVVERRK